MKYTRLKIIIVLLPLLVFANLPEGKFKKTKTVERRFDAGNNGTVFIYNIYGNVNVITGDQPEVVIKATVKVDGNDLDAVEERFETIKIRIDKKDSQITAKTIVENISEGDSSWWSWIFGGSSKQTNFKINYEVSMPRQWNLKIDNDYGHIYLNELTGNLDLKADYGSFDIGALSGDDNYISTDYFSNSNIDFVKNAEIKADYSRINITSAYQLTLNCDYTTFKIDDVRELNFNNDYGSINVKNVKKVNGSGDYQTRVFGNVDTVKFSGDYGTLKIDGLLPGFDVVDVSCEYTTVKIINRKNVAFRFEMNQTYGCFKAGDMTIVKEIDRNRNKTIKAYYKDQNTTSLIKIGMEYGCVKIE